MLILVQNQILAWHREISGRYIALNNNIITKKHDLKYMNIKGAIHAL
jgi:hypothetical protein